MTPTLEEGFFGMDFAGHAFELALQAGGTSIYSTTFPVPVGVTIQYSPLDTAVISDTMMLALYRQDGAAWVKTDTPARQARHRFPLNQVSSGLPYVRAVDMPFSVRRMR